MLPPFPPWVWAYWSGAIALAVLALGLGLWALFWDRSRARRRCPKCWYDMSGSVPPPGATGPGAPAITCPECGRQIKHERRLFRTRRRWRWAFASILLLLGAAALAIQPISDRVAWWSYAPTTVLILRAPGTGEIASQSDAHLRIRLRKGKVWAWQKRWIADRCASQLERAKEPVDLSQALDLLRSLGPDGARALPQVLPLLEHPEADVQLIAWVTLAAIGMRDDNTVGRINHMLMNPETDPIFRQAMVQTLGRRGPVSAPAVPGIVAVLERPELHSARGEFIIHAAAMSLGRIGPAGAPGLPALKALVDDPETGFDHRYAATAAISMITGESPNVQTFHVRMLSEPDVALRRRAAGSLPDYDNLEDDRSTITALLQAMGDDDAAVSQAADGALGAMFAHDPLVARSLQTVIDGPDLILAQRAARVLKAGPRSTAVLFAAPAAPAPSSAPPGPATKK